MANLVTRSASRQRGGMYYLMDDAGNWLAICGGRGGEEMDSSFSHQNKFQME